MRKIINSYPIEAALQSAASKDDIREFMSVWPDIVRDLTEYAKTFEHHDAPKWFSKLLQYNVTTGKKNRGLVVVMAYKILKQNGDLNDEELKLIQCLGWCVEMVSDFMIFCIIFIYFILCVVYF